MKKEFEALRTAYETGRPSVLDTYGATNPAEFFAVVTEAFFERPRAFRAKHPKLYAEFPRFFRQIPPATRPSARLPIELAFARSPSNVLELRILECGRSHALNKLGLQPRSR